MDSPGAQEPPVGMPAAPVSFQEASKSKMPLGMTAGFIETEGDFRAVPLEPRVRYRECRKNFAACSGGYVVDGCGEFIPSGEKDGYKCAACQCHRNFHRKEVEGEPVFNLSIHSRKWQHSAGNVNLADTDNSDYGEEKHGRIETEHLVRKSCGK